MNKEKMLKLINELSLAEIKDKLHTINYYFQIIKFGDMDFKELAKSFNVETTENKLTKANLIKVINQLSEDKFNHIYIYNRNSGKIMSVSEYNYNMLFNMVVGNKLGNQVKGLFQ